VRGVFLYRRQSSECAETDRSDGTQRMKVVRQRNNAIRPPDRETL